MLELAPGWSTEVDRGPGWLMVRVYPPDSQSEQPDLAHAIWALAEQQFTYRIVLELDHFSHLSSWVIGQLVLLHRRIGARGGCLRLCGLSESNQLALRLARLDGRLPNYETRAEAILGCRPVNPR